MIASAFKPLDLDNAIHGPVMRGHILSYSSHQRFKQAVIGYNPMCVVAFIWEAIYSIPSILHQFIHHRELLVGQSNELTEQLYRTHMRVDLGQILFNDLIVALSGYE